MRARKGPPRRACRPVCAGLALAVALVGLAGCGAGRPHLPQSRSTGAPDSGAIAPPAVPGDSKEFQQMALPPGQLTRALPVGTAWPPEQGPVYRSQCLRCHSVSQTSFAVQDWQESLHARAGVLCGNCHGSHQAGFVPQPGPDRCMVCHPQQVEEFLDSAHGPARAPGMRCVSCHEAHATDRGLVRTGAPCDDCHLESDHVQGYPSSRMGTVLAQHPPRPDGTMRAPTCVYCHMPESPLMKETGDFRNDRLTLHDVSRTVAKRATDDRRLADESVQLLLPLCMGCHSERNARYRLENSDPLILHWTPPGMAPDVRTRPTATTAAAGMGGKP